MKQQINYKQLGELSNQAKEKLVKWVEENNYQTNSGCQWIKILDENNALVELHWIPYLTIGQMIEFLDEKLEGLEMDLTIEKGKIEGQGFFIGVPFSRNVRGIELCDAFWEAVKELLEK